MALQIWLKNRRIDINSNPLTYNDAALDAQISVLVEPNFDTRLRLEELEDQELKQGRSQYDREEVSLQ